MPAERIRRLIASVQSAAGAAAEAALVVALDLDQLRARDRFDDLARWVVDVVPATEIARVVVGEPAVDRLARPEAAILDQASQELGMVHNFVGAAELGELVLDGV